MNIFLGTISLNPLFVPLALMYLKASCPPEGFKDGPPRIAMRDFALSDPEDAVLRAILAEKPDVVAFSCYLWNIQRTLNIARRLKILRPEMLLVLGGPQASADANALLQSHSFIDVVVRREGERTFWHLMKRFGAAGRDWSSIEGISFRMDGQVVHHQDSPAISVLDDIPSPYIEAPLDLKDREACLETQRGCLFRCTYCYYHKDVSGIRTFSLDRVRRDLEILISARPKSIYLMDPMFNMDIERAKAICRIIVELNGAQIPFHTELRAESVDAELADLLARAPFTNVEIGLQSTDPAVLAGIHRPTRLDRFEEGVRMLRERAMPMSIQLIYGLPGQTHTSFVESLYYAEALEPTTIDVFRLMVLPKALLSYSAPSSGLRYDPEPPYFVLSTPDMSVEEILWIQRWIRNLEFFRKSRAMQLARRYGGVGLADMLQDWTRLLDDFWVLGTQDPGELRSKAGRYLRDFCAARVLDVPFYESLFDVESAR